MADQRLEILVEMKDRASAAFKELGSHIGYVKEKFKSTQKSSLAFATDLGVIGSGIVTFGGYALKAAGQMEQTKIAFTTMLGSADKAKKLMTDLSTLSLKTPFNLEQLEPATKQLLAYGATQEQVLPQLKILGDISAGVGKEKFPQLITAFGQVQAATKLTGNELRQFTEAGVPLIGALAEQFKVSADKIPDMVSKGVIKFNDVQAALGSMTAEGGKFNDMMAKQSDSLEGKVSNLGEAWQNFLKGSGAQLIEFAKDVVDAFADFLNTTLPQLIAKIQDLTKYFSEHKEVLIILGTTIITMLVPAAYAAATAFWAMSSPLIPWMIGGAIIGGIIAGIYEIVKNWDWIKAKAEEIWDKIYQKHKFVFDAIGATVKALFSVITPIFTAGLAIIKGAWDLGFDGILEKVKSIFEAVKDTIKSGINWVIGKINDLISRINSVSSAVGGFIGVSPPQIPNIPMLAKGGIVNRPTLAMIGEAGPEAVVPLNKMGSMGGGGGITINIYGDIMGDDAVEKIGDQLTRKLQLASAIV